MFNKNMISNHNLEIQLDKYFCTCKITRKSIIFTLHILFIFKGTKTIS